MTRGQRLGLFVLFLPTLVITVVFYGLPAVVTAAMSFTDMDFRLRWNFVGFATFLRVAEDFLLPRILQNTVVYAFFTLAFFNVGLALLLALAATFVPERVGRVVQALWILPRLTPPIVYGIIWMWILDPTRAGLLNSLLALAGVGPVDWVTRHPMAVIVVTNGIIGASFGMVVFSSAIRSIPRDYTWAALADGATWLQQVRFVTLPLIRWPLLCVTAYQTLSLLTSYEYILIVTGGGPHFATTVWSLYAYNLAFGGDFANHAFGYGAALSLVLVVLGVAASVAYWRAFRFREVAAEPKIEVM